MYRQGLELAFLNAKIPCRVRKRKAGGFWVYPSADNTQKYAVETDEDTKKLIQKLKGAVRV